MIDPSSFLQLLKDNKISFFTGVPDSLLKEFCSCLMTECKPTEHIIAANEGAAIAIASGYYLSSGKIGLVYMQNSGFGNTINPLLSLADFEVYGIPMLLVIGWRGEPGVADEFQHKKQGRIQEQLLKALEIPYEVLPVVYTDAKDCLERILSKSISMESPAALLVRKGTFMHYEKSVKPSNKYQFSREEAIKTIVDCLDEKDIVVATTGKISRELHEYRKITGKGISNDFLTVGSMGHSSQIAVGIALQKPKSRVICLDGDGSLIMHMGSLAIIGAHNIPNLLHIVLNNGAHESVGGQPTIGQIIDFCSIAKGCCYKSCVRVINRKDLIRILTEYKRILGPSFIELRVSLSSRDNLGRPGSPKENKIAFMNSVNELY